MPLLRPLHSTPSFEEAVGTRQAHTIAMPITSQPSTMLPSNSSSSSGGGGNYSSSRSPAAAATAAAATAAAATATATSAAAAQQQSQQQQLQPELSTTILYELVVEATVRLDPACAAAYAAAPRARRHTHAHTLPGPCFELRGRGAVDGAGRWAAAVVRRAGRVTGPACRAVRPDDPPLQWEVRAAVEAAVESAATRQRALDAARLTVARPEEVRPRRGSDDAMSEQPRRHREAGI